MDLFAELKVVALKQSSEGELPAWLLAEILAVANSPKQYETQASQVGILMAQIQDYDSYAGVGCFDTSVSAEMIQATIRAIKSDPGRSDQETGQ